MIEAQHQQSAVSTNPPFLCFLIPQNFWFILFLNRNEVDIFSRNRKTQNG